jgi:hypothetical protein
MVWFPRGRRQDGSGGWLCRCSGKVAERVRGHQNRVIAIPAQSDAASNTAPAATMPGNPATASPGTFVTALEDAQTSPSLLETSLTGPGNHEAKKVVGSKRQEEDTEPAIPSGLDGSYPGSCALWVQGIQVALAPAPVAIGLADTPASPAAGEAPPAAVDQPLSAPPIATSMSPIGTLTPLPAADGIPPNPPAVPWAEIPKAPDNAQPDMTKSLVRQAAEPEVPAVAAPAVADAAASTNAVAAPLPVSSLPDPHPSSTQGTTAPQRTTAPQEATNPEQVSGRSKSSDGKPDKPSVIDHAKSNRVAATISTDSPLPFAPAENAAKVNRPWESHVASKWAVSSPGAEVVQADDSKAPVISDPPQAQAPLPGPNDKTLETARALATSVAVDASSARNSDKPQPNQTLVTPDGLVSRTLIPEPASGSPDRTPSETVVRPLQEAENTTPISPAAGVSTARIMEHLGQSEMHIGLRTTAFGMVEVHTVIHDNQVGMAVGTEKGDLSTLLAAEVPSLRAAFHHQDLQFEGVRFLGSSTGVQTSLGSGAHSDSRPFRQPLPGWGAVAPTEEVPISRSQLEVTDTHTGLNVHA